MGHKIFISYKYNDDNVRKITMNWQADTVRDYVDVLEDYFRNNTNGVYKGESDGEDLSSLTEDSIWEKLKDRIYDSTLTIVLISPNMKESYLSDRQQWIPWEISYSLKEESRRNAAGRMVTSSSNALLAIILPDRNGYYNYAIKDNRCCNVNCRTYYTDNLFEIIRKNMFNTKYPNTQVCNNVGIVYNGEFSYIVTTTWDEFIKKPNEYIDRAYNNQMSINRFNISKEID